MKKEKQISNVEKYQIDKLKIQHKHTHAHKMKTPFLLQIVEKKQNKTKDE